MGLPDVVTQICGGLAGAGASFPFGPEVEVWKVAGKIFAAVSGDGVVVKCADVETAELVISVGRARKAPYFHRSWVQIPWEGAEAAELVDRLRGSYGLIRATLPKKVQAGLG